MAGRTGKKKILLMSDDLRMHSGIATQSKEFVMGTLDKYEWVQIGGAINHPDNGKIMDMNEAFGFGFIIWNMKFSRQCRFFITTYGMTYQTHYIIHIITEVQTY